MRHYSDDDILAKHKIWLARQITEDRPIPDNLLTPAAREWFKPFRGRGYLSIDAAARNPHVVMSPDEIEKARKSLEDILAR